MHVTWQRRCKCAESLALGVRLVARRARLRDSAMIPRGGLERIYILLLIWRVVGSVGPGGLGGGENSPPLPGASRSHHPFNANHRPLPCMFRASYAERRLIRQRRVCARRVCVGKVRAGRARVRMIRVGGGVGAEGSGVEGLRGGSSKRGGEGGWLLGRGGLGGASLPTATKTENPDLTATCNRPKEAKPQGVSGCVMQGSGMQERARNGLALRRPLWYATGDALAATPRQRPCGVPRRNH